MSLRPGEWIVLAGSGVIAAFALLVGVLIYLKPPPVQYRYLEDARTQAGEAVYRRQGCGSCHKVFENGAKVGPALVRAGGWDPTRTFTADGLRSTDLPADVGEEATEGMRGTAPTSEGAPAGDAFATAYEERAEGVSRQTFDAQAFDAVIVSFLAAVRGGASDSETIRDNLQAVSGAGEGEGADQYTFEQLGDAINALLAGEEIDYEGASGPINFDENGDPGAALYEVWQFEGNDITTLDSFEFSGGDEG